jgi:hypothetical protein
MSKTFTQADVASHNKPDNLYIIVDEDVYDLTKFQDEHPGMLPHIKPEKERGNQLINYRTNRRKEDPNPRSRQRRQQAILEVPQRKHPQEIQAQTPSRLPRHKEECRAPYTPTFSAQGDREAAGGERDGECCAGGG